MELCAVIFVSGNFCSFFPSFKSSQYL